MRIPKYRRHSSNLGFVEFNRERIYFPGRYKSEESIEAYRNFLTDHGLKRDTPKVLGKDPDVESICFAYLEFALTEYGDDRNGEYHKMRLVANTVIAKAGHLAASQFGPKRLKVVRQAFLDRGLTRKNVNSKVGRVKRIFAWATEEELIPGSVYHGLLAVKGLRRTRQTLGKYKEGKKRRPVLDVHVEATLPELSPLIRDMVNLQRIIGARSSSLCRAKAEQFDRTDAIWLWRPRHKTESLGKDLVIAIGPKAQAILRPYLSRAEGFLFDPRTQRRNPRYGKRYTSQSYRQAVQRAIRRANAKRAKQRAEMQTDEEKKALPDIPLWSPHQLRHARGKAVRAKHGLEASKAALGHETLAMAELYSERDIELAKQIAREMG